MKDGVYIYDYESHALKPVISGDHRADIAGSFSMSGGGMPSGGPSGGAPGTAPSGGQGSAPAGAPSAGAGGETRSASFPVDLLLVSDPSKYRAGTDDLKKEWGAFSAGIITQNVMLFCSANDLGTRPRAMFDKAKLKTLLKLKDTQNPVIELPVGYVR
jgi:nitroreductase